MKGFYLLSLKWSKKDHYVWWKSDDSGYTHDLEKAGVYTEERIKSRPLYYSNTSTMPVPIELVKQGQLQVVVVADSANFNLFGIADHLKTAKEY